MFSTQLPIASARFALQPAVSGTRPARLAGALLLALTAAPALAQQAAGAGAGQSSSATTHAGEPQTLDKVEVTGSRLRQDAGSGSIVPVRSFTAEELKRQGVTTLADIARVIPQFGPSTSGDAWTSLVGTGPSPGLANRTTFNLGGLSLVSTSLGGVTLVLVNGQRLSSSGQAFSGGGNLEGFDLSGIPFDAIERIDILPGGASSIYGSDALAGVINIILKKGHNLQRSGASVRYDSPFEKGGGTVKTVDASTAWYRGDWSVLVAGAYEQGVALKLRDRWYTATTDLTRYGGQYDNRNSYLGAVWPADGRIRAIPSGSTGHSSVADFAAAGPAAVYDSADWLDAISPWRSKSLLINADWQHAPWLNLHLDLRLNEKVTTSTSYPYIGYYYPAYNLLDSSLRVPAGAGGNPYTQAVYLNKVFTDLPQRSTTTARNPAASLGVNGDVGAAGRWHYDATLGWARSEQIYRAGGMFNPTSITALNKALAAGSGPLLIYDSAAGNPNAPGVLESYLFHDWNNERTDTYTVDASIRGWLLQLPAGDVQVVAGAERLASHARFGANPDSSYSDFLLSGTIERRNDAVFGEVQIPLLAAAQGIPLVDALEANLSVRRDDYNDVGAKATPRYALLYRPTDWISVRAARSEGFKPASLWDLYAPYYKFDDKIKASEGLVDPLTGKAVGDIGYYSVGHPDLRPTTSVSKNLGASLALPFAPGLLIGVDYTRTDIDNAIGSTSYQDLIDNYPDRVVRDAKGTITLLDTSNVNLGQSLSETISWNLSYRLPTDDWGQFQFDASYARPISTRTQYNPTSAQRHPQLPKRASGALAWQRGNLDLSLAATWQSDFNLYPWYAQDNTYEGYIEWTPRVAWHLPVWLGGLDASLAIVNVFNEEPSRKAAGSGRLSQDYRGRRWALELKRTF